MKTKKLHFLLDAFSIGFHLRYAICARFLIWIVLTSFLFFSNVYAQNYAQMGLPEGAKHRIGKGTISGNIVFSPDGTRFAVGSSIGIWMYDAHTGEELALFTGHTETIWAVAFSPDGKMLASGATRKPRWWREDSEIFLWDADTGEHLATFKRPPEIASEWEAIDQLDITSLAFSPDGKMLASAGSEGTIRLWDIETGQYRTILKEHATISSVVFSPDGKTLASGDWRNNILLWDVDTGKHLTTFKGHMDRVWDLAFSPDGKTLASAGWDNKILLWDVGTGSVRHTLTEHEWLVMSVAFSPDGEILASGSYDKTIRLWDANTGNLRATLLGHEDSVGTVVFSPDGKTLVSGSYDDETIRVWDVDAEVQMNSITGHWWFSTAAFSPNKRTVAIERQHKTIWLWDLVDARNHHKLTGHTRTIHHADVLDRMAAPSQAEVGMGRFGYGT